MRLHSDINHSGAPTFTSVRGAHLHSSVLQHGKSRQSDGCRSDFFARRPSFNGATRNNGANVAYVLIQHGLCASGTCSGRTCRLISTTTRRARRLLSSLNWLVPFRLDWSQVFTRNGVGGGRDSHPTERSDLNFRDRGSLLTTDLGVGCAEFCTDRLLAFRLNWSNVRFCPQAVLIEPSARRRLHSRQQTTISEITPCEIGDVHESLTMSG